MHTVSYEEPQDNLEVSQQNSEADDKSDTQSRAVDLSPISPVDFNVSDPQTNQQDAESSLTVSEQKPEQQLEDTNDCECTDVSV